MAREMKDSGVEWIGKIPANWEVVKTKHCYTNHKLIAGNFADSYERLALTLNGVIKRPKDDSKGLQPEAFNGYQILKSNELVFKLIDLENISTSRVGYSPYTGIVSPAYIILHPNKDAESRYGVYYYLSMWQREVFNHMGDDGVRSSLNAGDLLNTPYLSTTQEEKVRIVSFLDTECSRIDSVIKQTRASIEEYKKLKQAVITQAVTKGIRPNREMKDCGIESIGEIPNNWTVKRVKYVANSLGKGNGITKEEVYEDGDIQCVRYGEIYSKYERDVTDTFSLTKLEEINNPRFISYGDILFAGTGELVEEIGKNIVYLGRKDCLAGGDIIIMKHSQNPIFLNFALGSAYSQNQKSMGKAKLKVVHISSTEIGDIRIALPSLSEQNEIVLYLNEKIQIIDDLIKRKEYLITELGTYKKSLIFEYVTGKKEVPA